MVAEWSKLPPFICEVVGSDNNTPVVFNYIITSLLTLWVQIQWGS